MLHLLATLLLAVTATATRNITGNTSPFLFPADTASSFQVIVTGTNFGTYANQPKDLRCRVKVPDNSQPKPGPISPAKVINDTHILCTSLSGYITAGQFGVAIESPAAKRQWWSSGTANIEFRNFIEATPDMRPYLSDAISEAELLIAVNIGAISQYPATATATTFTVCASLTSEKSSLYNTTTNPYLTYAGGKPLNASLEGFVLLPCQTFNSDTLPGGFYNGNDLGSSGLYNTSIFAVPFNSLALSKLPSSISPGTNLKVTVTIGKDFQLVPKYRRFSIASSRGIVQGQSVSVVDHRRRMVQVNGEAWLGVGFYVSGAVTKIQPKGYTGKTVPTLDLAKKTFTELVREGMTQIVPYGIEALSLKDRAELVSFLDHDLNATLKFDMFLVGDVINLLKYEIGSVNYTTTWNNLLIRIKSVRDSPSLIGYYICGKKKEKNDSNTENLFWKILTPFFLFFLFICSFFCHSISR